MDETRGRQIAQLLSEGLDAYGADDVDGAISAWERVIALDPENAEALDYISSAGSPPVPPSAGPAPAAAASGATTSSEGTGPARLAEVFALAGDGRLAEAWALLDAAASLQALDIEGTAVADLLRARLSEQYRGQLRETLVPRPLRDLADLRGVDLSPAARHLASLCDGKASVADLVTLSGEDAFEVLHGLSSLVETGLVSLEA